VLEDFLVFEGRGQVIAQILLVDLRNPKGRMQLTGVPVEMIPQQAQRLHVIPIRPGLLRLVVFGTARVLAFVAVQGAVRPRPHVMRHVARHQQRQTDDRPQRQRGVDPKAPRSRRRSRGGS